MSDIKRLLRKFKPGTRVRATVRIVYAMMILEIEEGHRGTVVNTVAPNEVAGMSVVHWDGISGAWATINDAIDELPS
ncbi:MAG: hypothetical protein ACREU5_06845 [Burkholderiales bacterium]